jgi:hypothetical protein
MEAYLAILSIQGIVNRGSARKIYLLNSPAGFSSRGGGWATPPLDQWALDEGMLPVPQERATLDPQKRWPALSFLANTYRQHLKGIIRIVPFTDDNRGVYDHQVAAAVTAAGMTDGVIATPAIEQYLKAEQAPTTLLADVQAISTPAEGYQWARTRYFTAHTNRSAVALFNNGVSGEMVNTFDYYIATRTFCTSINPRSDYFTFTELMKEYPPATCLMTKGENHGQINAAEYAGHYMYIHAGANQSVHSGFPSDTSRFPTPPEATPQRIDPNGLYLGFMVTDGDSSFFSYWSHWAQQRMSPQFGKVPVAWNFTSAWVDLFPNLVARRGTQMQTFPDTFELAVYMHDGGLPRPPAALQTYAKQCRDRVKVTNGILDTGNPPAELFNPIVPQMGHTVNVHGYCGKTDGNKTPWVTVGQGRVINTLPSGATQTGCNPDEMYRCVALASTQVPANTPSFAVIVAGDGYISTVNPKYHTDPCVWVKTVMDRCQAEKPAGRKCYFLLPRQLGATWRERNNRALQVAATASAAIPATEAVQAVDGLSRTITTFPKGAQWLQIDLGAVQACNELDLDWVTAPPQGYRVQVSQDQATWTDLLTFSPKAPAHQECGIAQTQTRYVRIALPTGPAALREIRVVQIDRSALTAILDDGNSRLKKAVVGQEPGQYAQPIIDEYSRILQHTQAVMTQPTVTQRAIDTEAEVLNVAFAQLPKRAVADTAKLKDLLQRDIALANTLQARLGTGVNAFAPAPFAQLQTTLREVQQALEHPLEVRQANEWSDRLFYAQIAAVTSCMAPVQATWPQYNLAYQRPVQSGGNMPGYNPEVVVDGQPRVWKSAKGQAENWIAIDLGTSTTIDTIQFNWAGIYATRYSIDVSNDGLAWREAYATTNGAGDTEMVVIPPTRAQFIKVNLQKWPYGDDYEITEIIVSGPAREALARELDMVQRRLTDKDNPYSAEEVAPLRQAVTKAQAIQTRATATSFECDGALADLLCAELDAKLSWANRALLAAQPGTKRDRLRDVISTAQRAVKLAPKTEQLSVRFSQYNIAIRALDAVLAPTAM